MAENTTKKIDPSSSKFLFGIGQRIKYLRTQKGLTQDELAKRMGYTSRSTINKIEKGLVDIPFTKIQEFANIFNVLPQFFFFNLGNINRLPGTPKLNKISIKTADETEMSFYTNDEVIKQIITLIENDLENRLLQQTSLESEQDE